MKCPICNFENPPSATRCEKCGYGFIQVTWPEIPAPEITPPEWPDLSGLQPAIPAAPITTAPSAEEMVSKPEEVRTPLDDELARMHVSRGFQAIREGLWDQARWEFAQARDLADNLDIVRMAEAQLRELQQRAKLPEELLEPAERIIERLEQEKLPKPEELARQLVEKVKHGEATPDLTAPPVQPGVRPRPVPTRKPDLRSAIATGLVIGIVNGALAACGAAVCLGLLTSPFLGLAAGWLTARRAGRGDIAQGFVAGGITGLVGWISGIAGYLLQSANDISVDSDARAGMACLTLLYIPLSAVMGMVGWRLGTSRRQALHKGNPS